MKNFLQRIASTVAPDATPRLHPMLGSIFAPASPYSLEALPSTIVSVSNEQSSPQPPAHARSSSPWYLQEPSLLGPVAVQAPSAIFSGTRRGIYPPDTDAPLLPQQEISPAHDIAPAFYSVSRGPAAPYTASVGANTDGNFPAARLSRTAGDAATGASAAGLSRLQPAAAAPSLRLAPARPAPEGAPRPGRREPDEIHIHIGRIEVAAVTPPVPRPSPAPARKSLSLEEYLRRGNGRQG